ncbi:uncharacterized protein EI90DRAFT_3124448 [Cantharellus anzutake]|uniref:uncharacterized protein n=1 Tax=Cantharellus anzutake TaxID=1750568 RepID=UPI00190530A6|nr:uncharacterized protein EI90DRAFT_3124448 [Cantharellus anzutake]KAF8330387.1 hypothetical protein EI90DRAFT_3124448 [Cantharellus anzutake]
MVTEEQYQDLLTRFQELQAILESRIQNPPPAPAPVPAPTPAPKPKAPKVTHPDHGAVSALLPPSFLSLPSDPIQTLPPGPYSLAWAALVPGYIAPPTTFAGASKDLNCFKVECGIYFHVHMAEFPDTLSQILFVLSYMKGGAVGAWATQRMITLLMVGSPVITMDEFMAELDAMFQDPNCEATT